ncbi:MULTISPECIES: metallophosphoesterase [unclassified Streptomyces]|uniref:metallophosphoesterase n=1 Tax=unclassified Streptomyces TaxID=2593676 RepID=UPI001BE5290A|nr:MULTISPECIES: metallophosphoesterase [unclassified Streptomyces]MBT2402355.1 metallophosphoesterase [Streptomyces sp. ISL-21]MBT2607687.1 metallophosphoesterase [Streptomyces sp. ISL-87]
MTVLIFALVALSVLALLVLVHRWLWIRLVRDTTRPGGTGRRVGTGMAFALPALAVAALVAGRAGAPFWLQQTVSWPGFMYLAVLLYLTLAMLIAEPVRAVVLRRGPGRPAPQSPDAPEPGPVPAAGQAGATATEARASAPAPAAPQVDDGISRRRFVARTIGGAAAAAAVGTVGYGTYGVLRGPSVKRVTVPLAKLPRAAHGFRIAVVSDIHLGPVLGRAHTQRIVDTVNRTQPDLIAIVGDLVDGNVHDLGPAAEPLRGLRAAHGSYFVTGNHEYFSGAQQWIDHVRELGLTPLENARRELPLFDLAGVNDIQGETEGHGPDFQAALGDRNRSRAAVLLAHQPVVIHDAVRHGVGLQLSGHTHGGQLWPGNYLAELANPTVAGLERYGDTQLYVSRGAGAWGPPVRVGAPSDITVVELASYRA